MRTATYAECLKKIETFCSISTKGFVVAEINDSISKEELIYDLQKHIPVSVLTLTQLSDKDTSFSKYEQSGILLVDEVDSPEVENIVINLNYNRDWFLKLNRIVVFVLPTVTVNRLIEYSYSFWSFVYLHVVFNCKSPSLITPHFILDFLSYDSTKDLHIRKSINKNVYGASTTIPSLISKYEQEHNIPPESDLERLLLSRFKRIHPNNQESIEEGFESIYTLGKTVLFQKHYEEALICFNFLLKYFSVGNNFSQSNIALRKNIVYAHYRLGNYLEALSVLNSILKNTNKEQDKVDDDKLSPYELAGLWNNTGIMLYMSGDANNALSAFMVAVEEINDKPITFHLGEILFNLSLTSLAVRDFKNALYYVNKAIENTQNLTSRSMRILCARYHVLKAYILVNVGATSEAQQIIRPHLDYLRSEIIEAHEYIMEAHYVFALTYLHKNNLEKAQICAEKASLIAKKIKATPRIKAIIFQLLGEIYFYNENYEQCRRCLYHACKQEDIFDIGVLQWMNETKQLCEERLKNFH